MVDAEQEAVAGKSILKRRVFKNEKRLSGRAASPRGERDDEDDCGKRYVTFDETISVKNDKDLVVKKPLKLTLVIENWKSGNATKTALETNGTDRGIVRRLVNTIEDRAMASKWMGGERTVPDRLRNRGRVNGLIHMFNSKSTSNKWDYRTEITVDF